MIELSYKLLCVVLVNTCEIFLFFFTAILTIGKLKPTNLIGIHMNGFVYDFTVMFLLS